MWYFPRLLVISSLTGLSTCYSGYSVVKPQKSYQPIPSDTLTNTKPSEAVDDINVLLAALPESIPNRELLAQSWYSYRQRFIQNDGRVIDYEASDRSTSEGQAYAMLRAVLIDDPVTFAKTLNWAENNLQRFQEDGTKSDNLWSWKWGRKSDGRWGAIDSNFASDGDIDAITALIFASRRWNRPQYLQLARNKLQDLWNISTATGMNGERYLLPGPAKAFVSNESIYLNPSYFAPYAFRIFAQVDPKNDWLSLVDSSYDVLEKSASLSKVNLPSDWVLLSTRTGKFEILPQSKNIKTLYSFDAYRVWWRLALDATWFKSKKAEKYLESSTQHLQNLWQQKSRISARINLEGKEVVDYEATSQYAMLYPAMKIVAPKIAEEILNQKLLSKHKKGIWDDYSAYYTQNLAWLGILPSSSVSEKLLKPSKSEL
ncbi:MAG: glycosyl hydrolase family 8 [Cyanobacteria bacterium P01_A01_bin.80]